MKLKHVFFSSLLLSVGFTACTNDDFTEISAPVNTSEAIALGENFTIKVGKGATTKAAFDEEEGVFSPYWEEGDKLGAAWVHKVTALDEDDNTIVTAAGTIGATYEGFYSNSPLALTEGAGSNNGTFATVDEANLFAGAYVLYYPYDKTVSMQGDEIPVAIKSYEFDAANPLKNVSDNMFSYSPVKFVPGGNQTGEFTLKQVPVLFRLRFTPDEKLNMDLSGGITINHIVVEARKGGNDVLVEEGTIKTATEPTVADYNTPAEDEALDDIVKYAGGSTVDHLFITTKGTDNDNYKMLVKSEPTKEEFVFSTMPFTDEADEIVIKVVTDKGTYAKTYTAADAAYINAFKKAAEEGGVVRVNVVLDVTDQDDVIYTAEEFVNRWNDAIAAGKDADDLVIGTDLTLEEGLVCGDANAQFTVSGHKLTVPSLDLTSTSTVGVTFDCPLVVEGKLFTSGDSQLTANELTAAEVEIQGDATLTVAEVENMTIATSGVVKVAGVDAESVIGKITNRGQLTPNTTSLTIKELDSTVGTLSLNNYTNEGTMTLGNVTATGTFENNGEVVLNGTFKGDFENNGEVTLNGVFDGEFNNNAGATLTINANQAKMILTNNAADTDEELPAAVVNISAGKILTAASSYTVTNNGIINVYGKLTETNAAVLTQGNDDARIIAKSNEAVITMAASGTALTNGYVMILTNSNIVNGTGDRIAYECTDSKVKVPTYANYIFVSTDIASTWLNSYKAKNLILNDCNIEFNTKNPNITMTDGTFTVAGDVTISLAKGVASASLTLSSTVSNNNSINKGASLTLCEGFSFYYGTKWTQDGALAPNGATEVAENKA